MINIEQAWRGAIKDNGRAVEVRSTDLANTFGEAAATSARTLLERHPDLVAPGILEIIVESERNKTISQYLGDRAMGLKNDVHSIGQGISVLLDSGGRHAVLEYDLYENMCRGTHPELLPEFVSLGHVNDRSFHAMRLNHGMLSGEQRRKITLGLNTEMYGSDRAQKAIMPVQLDVSQVVRIEGDQGELWQNPDSEYLELFSGTRVSS